MKQPAPLPAQVLKAFEKVPDLYLILSPELAILTASDAYLAATLTNCEEIVGRQLFDVFPDNPMAKAAHGVKNLKHSLQQALATKQPHRMAIQQYDVPLPAAQGGGFAEKYWLPLNTPVLDEQGQVQYIIHKVEDVTEQVLQEKQVSTLHEALTEERELRRKLAASQELHRISEEVASLGSYEADIQGSAFYFSDGLYRLFGEEPQSFTPTLSWIDARSSPEDAAKVRRILEQAAQNRQPYYYTRRIRRRDGEWRTVASHGKVICGADGQARKFVGLVQDVTEKVLAEQELKTARENLKATLDSSPYFIQAFEAVRDKAGKIVDFTWIFTNHTWKEHYGDMTGRSLLQQNPAVLATGLFEKFVEVTETGISIDHEQYYSHEQFQDQWFHQTLVKMDDGFVMTTEDITDRKKAEQEILQLKDEVAQRATDKYQALFKTIDEGFAIQEVVTDKARNVTDVIWREVNAAFEHITGMEDVVGKKVSEFLPNLEQAWLDALTQVYKTGEPLRGESYTADLGRWITYQYSRIGEAGSPFIAVVFNDITERKRREQQQTFLLHFSDTLRTLKDEHTIENTSLQLLSEFLSLDRAYVFVLYPLEDRAVVRSEQRRADLLSLLGEVRMSDFPETVRQIEDETLVINDIGTDTRLSVLNRESLEAVNLQAFVCASVRKGESNVIWSLAAATTTPRIWTKDEVALIEIVAERTWAAVERAKAEEALKESELKYRTLFETMDQGFGIGQVLPANEAAGGKVDWQWLEVNPQFERLTGLSRDAVLGNTMRKLVPGLEETWFTQYAKVAATGETITFEDYSPVLGRWFDVYVYALGTPEERRVAVLFTNTTERKQREQQQEYLLRLNDALRPIADPMEVQRVAMQVLGEHLSVDRAIYAEINIDEDWFEATDNYTSKSVQKITGRFPFTAFGPPGEKLKKGESLIIHDVTAEADDDSKKAFYSMDVRAAVAVPLIKKGKLVADLSVHQTKPRHWLDHEIALLLETAERTWAAVERARAEEALRESEERLQKVLSVETVGVIYLDLEGAIHDSNAAFERMSGYSKADLTSGQVRWDELIPPEFIKATFSSKEELITQGQSTPYEKQYIRPDGTRWWGLFAGKRLSDTECVEFVVDITDRKEAEEKLQQFNVLLEQQIAERTSELKNTTAELQKNLAKLLQAEEVARMGSWEYDVASCEMSWSAGMYRLFDLPAGSPVQPEIYLEHAVEADKPLAQQLVKKLRESFEPLEETLRLHVSGQVLTLLVKTVVQRDEQGAPVKIRGIDLNISEVKRLEAENLQMRLNQQKALLLAVLEAQEEERRRISEALHNGVAQILYAAKLNLEQVTQQVPGELIQPADKLLGEAIKETRRVSHELTPIILNDFGLEKAVEHFCRQYEQSPVKVNWEIDLEGRLASFLETALYRICQELLNNVMKHAQATQADVLLVQEDGEVTLKVRDNGKGISGEPGEMKGIGLRTITDRVQLLNGTFSITTPSTGTGTLVTVKIPVTGGGD
ncbi:PAS domain S-box-containing protein [Pontibacter ummariensis]|uniref:histidine kinase n=1 Tax=Pontibacter ummariensis TaxID=1610492 RepID=A0A239BBR6_9BACT|nr:PAS domain S-box protein [Pontibacter ummariensis]PRY16398.1 PAS domain S-box-containing protein [Pontibacter ummariensis]SNS04463.1 PAS domain S-box-containing protein [Pontibacter ummariensis]